MGVFNFAGYKMITSGSGVDPTNKTLLISCHGAKLGDTFTRPFPTVVQFCTPKSTALVASVIRTIQGKVTPVELATGSQTTIDNYVLTWYEHDPEDVKIEAEVGKHPNFDVMIFDSKATMEITLKKVMTFLKVRGYLYPSIWCLFCRVTAEQFQGNTYIGQDFKGKVSQSTMQANVHKVNATAVALELKQKGFQ